MPAQAVGVAAAIEPLMVMTNDRQNIGGRLKVLEDAFSDCRVLTHLPFFLGAEGSGFTKDCIRDKYLADVVGEAPAVQGK